MNIEVRTAAITDLSDFQPRYDEDSIYLDELNLYISHFPSSTILINNQVISVGGFIRNHRGVWSSWNIVSKEYTNYKRTVFKNIVTNFHILKQKIMKIEKIHRLQALVRLDRSEAIKFNHLLGYQSEAILRQYDPYGNDILIMCKIVEGE